MVGIEKKPYISLDSILDIPPETFLVVEEELRTLLAIAPTLKCFRTFIGDAIILPRKLKNELNPFVKNGYLNKMYHITEGKEKIPQSARVSTSTICRYIQLKNQTWTQWSEGVLLKDEPDWDKKTEPKTVYYKGILEHIPNTKKLIDSLPLKHHGRIILFSYPVYRPLIVHKDEFMSPHRDEFIIFNFNNRESFFIYDSKTNQKHFVNSKSFFFNDRDFHGMSPTPFWTFSLRIDCIFDSDLREKMGLTTTDYSYGAEVEQIPEEENGFFWID